MAKLILRELMGCFWTNDKDDDTATIWYPDGDMMCKIHDNLGLGIDAADTAQTIVYILNTANTFKDMLA